jgi:hypothetical protein
LSSRRYPFSFHEFSIHDLYLHRILYAIEFLEVNKMGDKGHRDGDSGKSKEEYDRDNRSDQLNPNNDKYQGD